MYGTTGIPLSYVIRDSILSILDKNAPIMNQYLLMSLYYGSVYQDNNRKLFNLDRSFVMDVQVGNNNVQILLAQYSG